MNYDMLASTSEGEQHSQDFTAIVGVGSVFILAIIVLVLGIMLASTVAFIKVRSKRRAKQHTPM